MSNKYHLIANILCELTDQLAADPAINFNSTSLSNINLTSRIGSGHATYCKHDMRNSEYTITYGKKMIKSKFNENEISNWLTYREICKKNYFNGDTSLACVLAHTICHEFSHLLQQHNRWHLKGSVHNTKFYKILDFFHQTDKAEKIKEEIIRRCMDISVSLEFETVKSVQIPKVEKYFNLNDEISFSHKKKSYNGRVIKINKKTIIVSVTSLFRNTEWKVPKQMALHKTKP